MEKIKKQLGDWLRQNENSAVRFLQKLVQEGGLRGDESRAQAIIIEKCRELGLKLDIWEIGGEALLKHPAFCSDRKNFSGSPNVVAVLPGRGGGKSLILNGHIDVVPPGDINDWENEPYSGCIKDGRLYGRGSTDMKGGTAALLLAIEAIISCGFQLKGDIIFQSVIEEESGGAGTLAAVLRGYKADGAIIPEPTNMKIFVKQQGSVWFRINVKGRAAHGGTRYEGVNAIEKGMAVISVLHELERRRNERITDPLYKNTPIPIPINIGRINSGDWPSSVPDFCTIEGRFGIAPGEDIFEAKQEMAAALSKLAEEDPWFASHPPELSWFGARWFPGEISTNHPLPAVLSQAYEEVMNEKSVFEAAPWGTDGGILSNIGGIPTVVFGPGTTSVAHDVNEYVELEAVFQAAEIIALTILRWCGWEKN